MQNENVKNLLQLIAENPELEILPLVNTDATCADYNCSVAKWGEAFVDEYYVVEECVYLRDKNWDELVEDEVDKICDQYDKTVPYEELEKIATANAEKYEWKKAIFVWIEPL
jgi:hypothetical protein